MITDRIGRHEVLLPINHKNYNFREMNSQVLKEGKLALKYLIKIPITKDVNILRPSHLLPAIRRQKHKSKRAHART